MKKLLLIIALTLLLTACQQQETFKENTINAFFGKNIDKYEETAIDHQLLCTEGNCPEIEVELKTETKDCYFCDSATIIENQLELTSSETGGLSEAEGCSRQWKGPFMVNFIITEKNKELIKAKGDIVRKFSQKSTENKTCEDEYSYSSITTVEMVFKP